MSKRRTNNTGVILTPRVTYVPYTCRYCLSSVTVHAQCDPYNSRITANRLLANLQRMGWVILPMGRFCCPSCYWSRVRR